MKCGLIGLSTVGKSTIFNLLTKGNVEVRKYGGGTADERNVGVTTVPDPRLDFLTYTYTPKKHTPATVEFVDVAGMVPGKARDGGLSPTLLAALREVDSLLHVVRCFAAEDIPHPQGSIDPARDAELLDLELLLADLAVVERRIERLTSDLAKHALDNAALGEKELALLHRLHDGLEAGTPIRAQLLTEGEEHLVRGYRFLSQKPVVVVANIDESQLGADNPAPELAAYAEEHALALVPLCGAVELDLARMDAADAELFMTDLGIEESGRDRLIREAYHALKLISFFTVGEDECRAWTITAGCSAVSAAEKIHSDIARGFIRAEVVGFDVLKAEGSWNAAKTKGLLRLEGKEYPVRDGDAISFRFSV